MLVNGMLQTIISLKTIPRGTRIPDFHILINMHILFRKNIAFRQIFRYKIKRSYKSFMNVSAVIMSKDIRLCIISAQHHIKRCGLSGLKTVAN